MLSSVNTDSSVAALLIFITLMKEILMESDSDD